jgi:4-amino-4-deoxy-L-arabinose transferase-like glycosyltransferase
MSKRAFLWGMVGVLLVAAALRLSALGEVPPGLYHDEAYHGLDVMEILEGWLPLYFPANNGREPLFIYEIAAIVALLGKSPFALRLAAFPIGVLTVAATAAMGRAFFSRRVGLLAAAVLAVILWHVHLSRVGFRAVLLPLFIALTAWQVARGVRSGQQRHWIAAGALYGLAFYTYTAIRFTPIALAAFVVYLLVRKPRPDPRSFFRPLLLAILSALVVLAPLGLYTLAHPDVVLGRSGQVSVFDPAIHGGDVWGTLARHTLRTLGMFFVRGDRIWRHNVALRPVFDPVLGAAFLLGLWEGLHRMRRDPATGFVLVWTGVMALPTLFAEDAPHFLRAVGVLPVVAFLPALGLDWVMDRLTRGGLRWAFAGVVLLFGLVSTSWAYFTDYAYDPMTGYWFERGATLMAGRINEFLGVGWDGERVLDGDPSGRQVLVERGLWDEWPQLGFLVAAPDAVTVGLESAPSADTVGVFVWPYGDWQRAWALLPTPTEIVVEEGPLSQGDRDPEPFTTYLAFFADPPDPAEPALARFSGGIELLGMAITPTEEGPVVRLRWRATGPLVDDYTVFLHYLRDGEMVAQADARPAGGHYPTPLWRPGDVINDDHLITGIVTPEVGRDAVRFGLWNPLTGESLYLLDEAGNPAGDWLVLPVRGE